MFSYALYWAPVWLGENPSEFSAWELAFLIPWTLFGVISSIFVIEKKAIKAWFKY